MPAVLEHTSRVDVAQDLGGIAVGAPVVTLDGVMPVEYLEPGDRVVTRSGVRTLCDVLCLPYSGEALMVIGGSLGHCLPGENTYILPDTRIVVRDWRARALFGMETALVPAETLEDGEFVRRVQVVDLPMFTLVFEKDEIVYAGGMELAATIAEAAVA
jgi:Hint domain